MVLVTNRDWGGCDGGIVGVVRSGVVRIGEEGRRLACRKRDFLIQKSENEALEGFLPGKGIETSPRVQFSVAAEKRARCVIILL